MTMSSIHKILIAAVVVGAISVVSSRVVEGKQDKEYSMLQNAEPSPVRDEGSLLKRASAKGRTLLQKVLQQDDAGLRRASEEDQKEKRLVRLDSANYRRNLDEDLEGKKASHHDNKGRHRVSREEMRERRERRDRRHSRKSHERERKKPKATKTVVKKYIHYHNDPTSIEAKLSGSTSDKFYIRKDSDFKDDD